MNLEVIVLALCVFLPLANCACQDGSACQGPEGDYGICSNGTCIPVEDVVRNDLSFEIVVMYRETNFQQHGGKDLFIRGNALGLSWKTGIKLKKHDTDTWIARIAYQSADDGFRCQNCDDPTRFNGDTLQYRIYVDDVIDMVGGNFEQRIPVSMVSSYFQRDQIFHAFPHFFSKKGTTSTMSVKSPEIGGTRKIVIYKPPSFSENTYKIYPTLIALDVTQDYAPIVAATFDKQMAELGTVREFIAIGFGDYGSDPNDRTRMMTPVEGLGVECINGTFADRCDDCFPDGLTSNEQFQYLLTKCGRLVKSGGQANDTLDFLIQTALPRAQPVAMHRMLVDQPNLGIAGYSLGGLMACYAAWTRPTVFGVAACQSPSFWWPPLDNYTSTGFFFENVSMKDQSLRTDRPVQRIYLDVGGAEPGPPFDMIHSTIDVAMDMKTIPGFQLNRNLWAHVFPGESHSPLAWMKRLWSPLRTLYPAHPPPPPAVNGTMPSNRNQSDPAHPPPPPPPLVSDTMPSKGNHSDTNGCPGNHVPIHVSQTIAICIVVLGLFKFV